ncbi:i-AAA protease yme1 [Dipsacomyces acuminosporus]|nr:i-AAA protease yme1 [Dipsacomyces acuminosporus]
MEGYAVPVSDIATLGYDGNSRLDRCAWKKVRQVYRHRVDEIYEIACLGDTIRTTGDHSVFIRTAEGIKAVQTRDLRVGDGLVDLPYRQGAGHGQKSSRQRQDQNFWPVHSVDGEMPAPLPLWLPGSSDEQKQHARISCHNEGLPDEVPVTESLMRLFGVYTARGRAEHDGMYIGFGSAESELMLAFAKDMEGVFGVSANSQPAEDNGSSSHTLAYSSLLGQFFGFHCGYAQEHRHVPEVLWTAPAELFHAFFSTYAAGSGGQRSSSTPTVVRSANQHLLCEFAWLSSMHGIKAVLTTDVQEKEASAPWKLEIGSNRSQAISDQEQDMPKHKKMLITGIKRLPYTGYVYDFCGCDNEAFFGGNNPVLLHNSKVRSLKIQLADDVDLNVVARGTPGFSGAELQNLLNIAAIEATKQRAKKVTNKHLDFAKDRIIMGSERKSAVITPEAKLATAYHEGGHTLAAMYTPGAMPLHKVTIMPRGHALGVTVQLPESDRESINKSEYLAEIDVCMGGRAAEELVYGPDKVTSGCSSDLQRATRVANAMVGQFGMNEKVGLVAYSEEERAKLSAEGKSSIEAEVRALNEAANARVMTLLRNHREELDRLAKALVEYETLDKNEVERAVKGLPIEREDVPHN